MSAQVINLSDEREKRLRRRFEQREQDLLAAFVQFWAAAGLMWWRV